MGAGGNLGSGVEGGAGQRHRQRRVLDTLRGMCLGRDLPGDHSHTRASNAPRPGLSNMFNLQFHVCTLGAVTISSLDPVFHRHRKGAPHVLFQEPTHGMSLFAAQCTSVYDGAYADTSQRPTDIQQCNVLDVLHGLLKAFIREAN